MVAGYECQPVIMGLQNDVAVTRNRSEKSFEIHLYLTHKINFPILMKCKLIIWKMRLPWYFIKNHYCSRCA